MKRSLKFICQSLRDVHTIVEYLDGTVTHIVRDKITGRSVFIDDDRDECLALLDSDSATQVY